MDFRVVIPARYASTRLPGKVLMEVEGKSLLQHVYERALESDPESVVIAVDDERVAEVARGFGAQVCMTSSTHQCGTERLSEVVDALSYDDDDIVLGLQADEPMISPEVIRQLAADLEKHERVKVASLYEPITTVDDLFDPHVVKVVLSRRQFALYFSRAPIPWGRDTFDDKSDLSLEGQYFRHIGLYGYRSGFLREYMEWPQSPLESVECLEQLRILWNGGRLHMSQACRSVSKGIDTQADLDALVKLLNKNKKSSTV